MLPPPPTSGARLEVAPHRSAIFYPRRHLPAFGPASLLAFYGIAAELCYRRSGQAIPLGARLGSRGALTATLWTAKPLVSEMLVSAVEPR